jgi:hypothetical protein
MMPGQYTSYGDVKYLLLSFFSNKTSIYDTELSLTEMRECKDREPSESD